MTTPIGPRRNLRATPPPLDPPPEKKTSTGKKGADTPAPRPEGLAAHAEDVVVPSWPGEDKMVCIGTEFEVREPRDPSTGEPTGNRTGEPTAAEKDPALPDEKKPRPDRKGPPPPIIPGRPQKAEP